MEKVLGKLPSKETRSWRLLYVGNHMGQRDSHKVRETLAEKKREEAKIQLEQKDFWHSIMEHYEENIRFTIVTFWKEMHRTKNN